MLNTYLEFEKPIKELDEKIIELKTSDDPSLSIVENIARLEQRREETIQKIFSKLNRWQRVQLARHPNRPYTLDYIQAWSPDFVELHGDRHFADDPSVVTGIGSLNGRSLMYIGQQKGRNTKENLYRNFGMMRPEGYRKALRMMKLAEKFHKPIVTLVDTQGAYPGLGAEERGQGEAIARNLFEMAKLQVPIISIVIGEGASGGALGIGLADRMLMLENTWYSVISPEGCASILWRDPGKAPEAAEALKVIPKDLVEVGICDRIVSEPNGGAHRDPQSTYELLKAVITEELSLLEGKSADEYLTSRLEKYDRLSSFIEV